MDFLFCFSNAFDVRIIIDVCVAPLNYLTNEGNGAIEMQHNNNIVYQSWPILLWTVSFVIRMFTSFRCFKSMPLLNRSKYIYTFLYFLKHFPIVFHLKFPYSIHCHHRRLI